MAIILPSREGAVAAAQREVPYALSQMQISLAKVLDPERDVEWASRNDADVVKEVTSDHHQSAVLLHRLGAEYEKPCKSCSNGAGTFRRCISSPEVVIDGHRRAFWGGACSNCVWNGHPCITGRSICAALLQSYIRGLGERT